MKTVKLDHKHGIDLWVPIEANPGVPIQEVLDHLKRTGANLILYGIDEEHNRALFFAGSNTDTPSKPTGPIPSGYKLLDEPRRL